MNEEELKRDLNKELCFDENMVGYKVMNNYIDKAIKIGKLEQKKEELEFLKVFTQRDMHLHIKESDGTPRIVCDYNLILDRIKQLQKEVEEEKQDETY